MYGKAVACAAGMVLFVLTATGATAAPQLGGVDSSITSLIGSRAAHVRSDVLRVRSAMQHDSFAARVRATTEATGNVAPAVRSAARDSARSGVAGLRAAVARAARELTALRTEPRARPRFARIGSPTESTAFGRHLEGEARLAVPATPSPLARAQLTVVSRAALRIAVALDRHLEEIASTRRPASDAGAAPGCDVLDQTPYLCIGSDADNTYTQNEELLVDLGGNDTYQNSAGGAPFTADGALFPVSVNVDLAGDDHYVAPASTPGWHGVLAQGAGAGGALGIAVDLAGNDSYLATLPAGSGPERQLLAQGAGIGVSGDDQAPGAGFLFDLGGDDTRLVDVGAEDNVPFVVAQGGAWGAAMAGLVDVGKGSDVYRITSTGQTGGARAILAQGSNQSVLYDDGGTDRFAVSATATNPADEPPDVPGLIVYCPYGPSPVPAVCTWVQGSGGMLLEGEGATSYDLDLQGDGFIWMVGQAQGASIATTNALDDQGGDDSYGATVSVAADRTVDIGNECDCETADALVSAYSGLVDPWLIAQGASWASFGAGLLEDHGGNDTYDALSSTSLDATLHDSLSAPSEPARLTAVGFPAGLTYAQGAGGSLSEGTLVDHDGTDAYTLGWHRHLSAEATSLNATGSPRVTAMQPGRTSSLAGQGATEEAGYGGELLDLGGNGDRFVATASSDVRTSPGGGAFQEAGTWPRFQGTIGGTLVALGEDPTIVSSPSLPVCVASPGQRGFGQWLECGEYAEIGGSFDFTGNGHQVGGGIAPSATGASPTLAFGPDTPPEGAEGATIPVSARLLGPDGQPIAGALVHFTLQYTIDQTQCTPECTSWSSGWETQALTGPDGVASATLPLAVSDFIDPSGRDFRILATFDGAHGVYPRHTVSPLVLAS